MSYPIPHAFPSVCQKCLSAGLASLPPWLQTVFFFLLPWFMFVSHPIFQLQLFLLIWKKKNCKLKCVSKSNSPPFLELSLSVGSLCASWDHCRFQSPHPTEQVTSEVQDLLEQTGALSFALPFPLFTWGFWLEQRGCAPLINIWTGEGDPQLTLCSAGSLQYFNYSSRSEFHTRTGEVGSASEGGGN